jgi:DNA-binding response OmpR family regulator
MKVLIIEDEPNLVSSIIRYLRKEYFICETATNFSEANEKLALFSYDCIILDISLPDGNGLHLLESLKTAKKNDGVIIISAKHSLDDRLTGLRLGADDYLSKPFHLSELSARINAVIRRKQFNGDNQICIDELTINYALKTVHFQCKPVELTRTEFDVLIFMISNKNKVVTKKAVAEHISGDCAEMFDNFDFVYAHFKNIRKKLLAQGCPDYIKSVYAMGYKFVT